MLSYFIDVLERPLKKGMVLRDRYTLSQFIGKGSYGMAYRAFDQKIGTTVVVKQLRKRKRKNKAEYGWLEREARMLSVLSHPAIPKLIDLFDEDQKCFLVMECVEGKNVEELIFHEGQKYNEKESFLILLEVLKVIQYLHENGIIHRDLRLPNILIEENRVFVIDFGLAVFIDEEDPVPIESMPFEKRLYREVSVKSDFYALGHFVLFLLYSNYQITSKKEGNWEDELQLGIEMKRIIRKLLKLENSYGDIKYIIEDIENALINL